MDRRRVALWVGVGALCVTALVAVVAIVVGEFDEASARVLIAAWAIALYAVLMLVCAAANDRRPVLAGAGLVACAVGAVLAIAAVVAWNDASDSLVKATFAAFVVAFALAHSALLEWRRRAGDAPTVRGLLAATYICIAVVAAMLVYAIVAADTDAQAEGGYFRALGVALVLDVLGTALVPLLRKLSRASAAP